MNEQNNGQNQASDNKVLSDQSREFLTVCFSENLNHARHVENERNMLFSLYTVFYATMIAALIGFCEHNLKLFVIMNCFMIFITIVVICLDRRWVYVYKQHKSTAQDISERLYPDTDMVVYNFNVTPDSDDSILKKKLWYAGELVKIVYGILLVSQFVLLAFYILPL